MQQHSFRHPLGAIIILMISCLFVIPRTQAQNNSVQKATQAVFRLTTFKKDGTILTNSHGVFIASDGTAIAPLTPFQGAAKATIVDVRGNVYNVDVIEKFNELYNLARFKIDGKPNAVAILAPQPSTMGSTAWLLPYSIKRATPTKAHIDKTEKFMDNYTYYIFSMKTPDLSDGCPMVNEQGQVIGLLDCSNTAVDAQAADPHLLDTQQLTGLSINDRSLEGTTIRIALPKDVAQAELTMMVAKSKYDTPTYQKYIDDFIRLFPTSITGYQERAFLFLSTQQFAEADRIMQTAVNKVTDKALAHSAYADLIYKYVINDSAKSYTNWNMEKALQEAQTAYQTKAELGYLHQVAQIEFALGRYNEAYSHFIKLTTTNLRNPMLFYEAAQCKSQLKAPEAETMALLDSAIINFPKNQLTAPYYLTRGSILDGKGQYRLALKDYNTYDTLMYGKANHSFYYQRYKCEMQLHWWQQALNDIAHAIVLNRTEPTYYAEMAALQLRLGLNEDALLTARRCTEIAPEYADGFILMALAQIEMKQKTAGLNNLEKAKALGDSRAQNLIDKYK